MSEERRPSGERNPERFGGCFILCNKRGEWWDGGAWSRDLASAEQYDREPDPDSQARAAAAEVEARTGISCLVVYVTRQQRPKWFAAANPPPDPPVQLRDDEGEK